MVGEVPEGRGVLLGRGWALIQEVWSKELLRDRWGGPSVLLGNRTVARSWRGEGSMFQEIAEMIQQGTKIRGLSSRCIAVYF